MTTPVQDYMNNFTKLLVVANKMLPNNQHVIEVRNKFNIAKQDEVSFIETTGGVIWEYRQQIKRNDRDEILNYDYTSRVARAECEDDNKQLAINFIATVLDKCKTVTPTEWNIVHGIVSNILKSYADYLLICKQAMMKQ